jgi:hypothetical protein
MTPTLKSNYSVYQENYDAAMKKKKQAQSFVSNIARLVFNKFDSSFMSEQQNIKNFDKFYAYNNQKIELTGLSPILPISHFLKQLNSNIVFGSNCIVTTDNNGIISNVDLSYTIVKRCSKSGMLGYKISISYDSNFEYQSLHYLKSKSSQDIVLNVTKHRNMLCPLDDEFRLLEVFLNDDKEITKELFPEWYFDGAYRINTSEFENNLITLRMLII